MINLSFENKVALVTGAGMGMGLATAQAFAEAGAAVVLADINERAVQAEAEALIAAGHKALAVRCNVADEADVAAEPEAETKRLKEVEDRLAAEQGATAAAETDQKRQRN